MSIIRDEFNKIMEEFEPVILSYDWRNKDSYAEWLFQTYKFVNHSTRLLSLGAGFCSLENEKLHKRFLKHLDEESGHEVIAVKSLNRLGYSIEDFHELLETTAFYRTQYWSVQNRGPYALMGWILFLEGVACKFGPLILDKVSHFGPGSNAFLRIHAEEDVGHLDSAFSSIKELGEAETMYLIDNMKFSYDCYKSMLDKVFHKSSSALAA